MKMRLDPKAVSSLHFRNGTQRLFCQPHAPRSREYLLSTFCGLCERTALTKTANSPDITPSQKVLPKTVLVSAVRSQSPKNVLKKYSRD